MSARIDRPAIGVVFAVVGMALCVALAYAMTLIRTYGPIVREAIHATLTPQFAAGMFFMALVICAGAFLISLDRRA